MMTDALRVEIIRAFKQHFLVNSVGQRPAWSPDPYRARYFKLFMRAQEDGPVDGDTVSEFLQTHWLPKRPDLDRDDRTMVRNICRAWGEWFYAMQQVRSLS
jgi:hypothetical protein